MLGRNKGDDTLRSKEYEEKGVEKRLKELQHKPLTSSSPKGMTPPSITVVEDVTKSTTDTKK
jgi:hypothetical protein